MNELLGLRSRRASFKSFLLLVFRISPNSAASDFWQNESEIERPRNKELHIVAICRQLQELLTDGASVRQRLGCCGQQ